MKHCISCGKPASIHIIQAPHDIKVDGNRYRGTSYCSLVCLVRNLPLLTEWEAEGRL